MAIELVLRFELEVKLTLGQVEDFLVKDLSYILESLGRTIKKHSHIDGLGSWHG